MADNHEAAGRVGLPDQNSFFEVVGSVPSGIAPRSSPGTHKRAPAGYSDVCPLMRYESFDRRTPATLSVAHGGPAGRGSFSFSAPVCIGPGRGGS